MYINDPLGRKISLGKDLCKLEDQEIEALDLYDDLFSVISKPAILIETSDDPAEYYYFRSVGWHLSILMKVKCSGYLGKAYKCTLNPSDADIVDLLRTGKQII